VLNFIFPDQNENERRLCYKSLDLISSKIARVLLNLIKAKNLKSNQDGDWIVSVCMKPSNRLITALLGIWKSGAAYLPLDFSFPSTRIKHILDEAKPALIIYEDDFENIDLFEGTLSVNFSDLLSATENIESENFGEIDSLTKSPFAPAVILYTSGSTGIPKGVRLSHAAILNRLEWQWERFPFSSTEKICVFKTALTFLDSVSEIFGPLLRGLSLLIVPKCVTQNPQKLVSILEKYQIERLILVPTLLRSILMYLNMRKNGARELPTRLKIWICSGEVLTVQLAKEFFNHFEAGKHFLCNFYGSTEVMGDVTYFIIGSENQIDHYKMIPIGYPIFNTTIYILDENYQQIKNGKIGEIFVSGSNLALGYVNGRDSEKFITKHFSDEPGKVIKKNF
jgi:non-ribosomal peptide synthetase component F